MYTQLLLIFLFVLANFMFIKGKCFEPNAKENYLGTKSPYRSVANISFDKIEYEGCKPLKLWALIRHGTRNPSLNSINRMRTRLPEIRDLILENFQKPNAIIHNSDLDNLRKWEFKLEDSDVKKLTYEGKDEMLELAERLQSRFPEILPNIYSESYFNFKYTATQRTRKSAQAFVAGLFGKKTSKDVEFPIPLEKDPILRFYKLCNKWRKEVKKNPKTQIERIKFQNSSIMKNTVRQINQRLDLINQQLDLNDIFIMYMACAFETAWDKRKKSPWCSPFLIDDLKVIEYAEDLKYYWQDGYGQELTYKQACPAFNDMFNFFYLEKKLPNVTIYFTHSGTILKMLAHLGLYKDDPLLADDYLKNSNRQWKVSKIDTFGSNLIFTLYDCNGIRKILTMHQENIIKLPPCPSSDLCDLDEIKKYYDRSINECSFENMCEI